MMKKQAIYISSGVTMLAALAACSSDVDEAVVNAPVLQSFTVRSKLEPMEGEPQTRISVDGSQFLVGDMIRLKAVTPYDHNSKQKHDPEFGESTWGGTIDNYFLLRCNETPNNDGWTAWVTSGFNKADNLDLNGDGYIGDTSAPSLQFESQQTPYVYTANTWNRSVGFQTNNTDSKWRTLYKSTFYADQSILKNFQSSDLLWAQIMMQTCTDQVTLSFHHVLSELIITIPTNMPYAIVTLENMPDVDLQEFVVGDKYANTYYDYNNDPLSFSRISYVEDEKLNGQVIGISYIENSTYKLKKLSDVSKTGNTYVAYKESETQFRVIVPPMQIADNAAIVLRDENSEGEATKYVYNLKDQINGLKSDNTFKANTCYPITLSVKEATTPEPDSTPNPETGSETEPQNP